MSIGVLNPGKHCWDECNFKQGSCYFCGTGLCCRKGYHDLSNGCDGSIGDEKHHICVSRGNDFFHD